MAIKKCECGTVPVIKTRKVWNKEEKCYELESFYECPKCHAKGMVAVTFDYQGDAPNCGFMAVEKYWNEEKHFRK
jgi:hypothetical protein